ncbi:unnamed protein product [Parajaminaea phylloscopi]
MLLRSCLTLPLMAACALAAGQCTFYSQKGCSGSTSLQNLPLAFFPAYSSFRCDSNVKACYPRNTCDTCASVSAGSCGDKSTVDKDQKVQNYVCFLFDL